MQAIPSLVVVVDNEGVIVDAGYDETRAGVNNAFRNTLGWSDGQIVRRSVLDFIDPADAYVASMMIAGAANGMAMPQKESRWLARDGHRVDVAWTATPIDDVTGRAASLVLLSGVDITERKQQEAEIRASRSRIIEAAGEARRKLERNLHDGAQQRLVSISVSLRLAESLLDSDPAARPAGNRRLPCRARCGARGAPRARPGDPPGGAHRSGPPGRDRSAGRAHAAPDRDRSPCGSTPCADRSSDLLRHLGVARQRRQARLGNERRRSRRGGRGLGHRHGQSTTGSAVPTRRAEPGSTG